MSTHRYVLRRYRNTCAPLFLVGCGLLLALQLWSASVAFASTGSLFALSPAPAPIPKDNVGAPKDQGFALASVSVVRLLVSYTTAESKPVANCTGLGVLVKSLPVNGVATLADDWVLTDGSLVNSPQAACASGNPMGAPSQIQIYFNTGYNNKSQVMFRIDSNSTPSVHNAISCPNPLNCVGGPALIHFQGNVVPYLNLTLLQADPTSSQTAADHAIALTQNDRAGTLPATSENAANDGQQVVTSYTQSMSKFLTPQFLNASSTGLEAGTPSVDSLGQLTSLHLNSPTQIGMDIISSLIKQATNSTAGNAVNIAWDNGIIAYYQKKYTAAQTDFQQAANANPNFQGAKDFATFAQKNANGSGARSGTSSAQPNGNDIVIPGLGIAIPLWLLSIIVLVLLVLILLLTSLISRSRTQRRRAFKAEMDEANRHAAHEAQQIEAMEASKQAWAQHNLAAEQPTVPVQQQGLQDKTVVRKSAGDLRCPRCGELVARDANYCPNCRLVLAPSESGLHLRVPPAASVAQSIAPGNANSHAAPPDLVSILPAGSFIDQPTIPQVPPPPPPLSPVLSTDDVVNHPTVEMGSDVTWKKGSASNEITLPHAMQQMQGKRLGFVVGTRSDPGIKRKYKPNEDSLLAAQGLVNVAPGPQPFGLFVIADGMGGHANGQDASRLAIQTIIETTLPKLVNNGAESMDYSSTLVDGIQSANQAVHQQNMDKRGDMGTTVTAALVVGSVAYVANVGDSRTYLYRESEGLQKVTNDHSVVASLVEAGIIKPDDIYTHPKRNQIYRSLGEKSTVEVDVFTVQLHEGDKLMLCSDGLWDMVRDPKIEEVIKHPVPNPSKTGEALIQSALEGGGEDNVSVIVVQITEGGNPEALPRVQLLAKPDSVKMPQF